MSDFDNVERPDSVKAEKKETGNGVSGNGNSHKPDCYPFSPLSMEQNAERYKVSSQIEWSLTDLRNGYMLNNTENVEKGKLCTFDFKDGFRLAIFNRRVKEYPPIPYEGGPYIYCSVSIHDDTINSRLQSLAIFNGMEAVTSVIGVEVVSKLAMLTGMGYETLSAKTETCHSTLLTSFYLIPTNIEKGKKERLIRSIVSENIQGAILGHERGNPEDSKYLLNVIQQYYIKFPIEFLSAIPNFIFSEKRDDTKFLQSLLGV